VNCTHSGKLARRRIVASLVEKGVKPICSGRRDSLRDNRLSDGSRGRSARCPIVGARDMIIATSGRSGEEQENSYGYLTHFGSPS
jgi:hypothetical protein